jgi:hypothetical protein
MDQLNALAQEVITPIPLEIADDLGHRHHKGKADGQSCHGRVEKPEEADGPFGAYIWNLDVHR